MATHHHHLLVVGYDGSTSSDLALDWAADEAGGTGSRLQVLVATAGPAGRGGGAADAGHRDRVEAVVAQAQHRVLSLGVPATVERRDGDPLAALVDAGARADLLVLGAGGHGGLEDLDAGGFPSHVAARAPCTVTVVRTSRRPGKGIVVGVEAGPSSAPALRYAVSRAQRTGEEVVAVHGWKPPRWLEVDAEVSHIDTRSAQGARLLAEATAGLTEEFPDVVLRTQLAAAPPATALCEASDGASLLVVGSRGRAGVARLLLGSVADDVLRHAPCSVAVAR